jgi:hypothetical protein
VALNTDAPGTRACLLTPEISGRVVVNLVWHSNSVEVCAWQTKVRIPWFQILARFQEPSRVPYISVYISSVLGKKPIRQVLWSSGMILGKFNIKHLSY